MKIVDAFKNDKTIGDSTYFKNISKDDFTQSLYDLICNPDALLQCDNTCGIAAIAQGGFEHFPEQTTKNLIDLYMTGKSTFGDDIKLSSKGIEN